MSTALYKLGHSGGPPGCWGAPPVTEEAHLAKVRDCLAIRMTADQADEVIAEAQRFEEPTPDGLAELMRRLAAS